jgi:putative GTP pyrophosphokinase
MDMAGIRVITYLDSEAQKVSKIIKSSFTYFKDLSVDKSDQLGTDKVGYRSIHFVCCLNEAYCAVPENKEFAELKFEIQVRTILQHAWAEFEHDRNYKLRNGAVLPKELERRLKIVAGNLELIDWTFEQLASSITDYTLDIRKKTFEGDLSVKISSPSLMVYLRQKFDQLVKQGLKPLILNDFTVITELSVMGIDTLEELDNAIPTDFIEKSIEYQSLDTYRTALRDIMIIRDVKLYFEQAWQESWYDLIPESIDLFRYYNVPIEEYITKYGLQLFSPEYEYPEPDMDYEPPEYEPDYDQSDEEPPDMDYDYEPPDEEAVDMEPPEEEQPELEQPDEEPPEYEPSEDEEPPDEQPPDDQPPFEGPPDEEQPDEEPS